MKNAQKPKCRNIIVILGPTASGKTALGIALAKQFGGVILSADSRQVYRGLDIGTAKVTKREMQDVPHHLLDVASPRAVFTVDQFQRRAQLLLKRLPLSTPIFVVGGSPLYIDAILNPAPFPSVPPNTKLRQRLERKTAAQLLAMLRRRDPQRAITIDHHNRRRLIRALEIVAAIGRVPPRLTASPYRTLKLGLDWPRSVLYRRIDARLDRRLPAIIREVRQLHRHGLSWTRLEQLGLEYRWGSRLVRGLVDPAQGAARLKGDIHAFARRQLTWWRKDKTIRWVKKKNAAVVLVRRFLSRAYDLRATT